MMRDTIALVLLLLLAGCTKGTYLYLEVRSDEPLQPTALRVTVETGGRTTVPLSYGRGGTPLKLPETLVVTFDESGFGSALVSILALGQSGGEMAHQATQVQIEAGATTRATVTMNPLWRVEDKTLGLNAVLATNSTHVWAAGASGTVLFSSGDGHWQRQPTPIPNADIYALGATDAGNVIAAADGITLLNQNLNTTDWLTSEIPPVVQHRPRRPYAMWSPRGGNAGYFFGDAAYAVYLQFDPPGARELGLPLGTTVRASTGWTNLTETAMCIGGEFNTTQQCVDNNTGMPEWRVNQNVDGSGDSSVTIFGLWQAAVNDIWAVGTKGTILRAANCYNGGKPWNRSPAGVNSTLRAIWASSSSDLFIVGDGGVILHGDGENGWRREESSTTFDLKGVAGSSASSVYAVGDGVILHRNE